MTLQLDDMQLIAREMGATTLPSRLGAFRPDCSICSVARLAASCTRQRNSMSRAWLAHQLQDEQLKGDYPGAHRVLTGEHHHPQYRWKFQAKCL